MITTEGHLRVISVSDFLRKRRRRAKSSRPHLQSLRPTFQPPHCLLSCWLHCSFGEQHFPLRIFGLTCTTSNVGIALRPGCRNNVRNSRNNPANSSGAGKFQGISLPPPRPGRIPVRRFFPAVSHSEGKRISTRDFSAFIHSCCMGFRSSRSLVRVFVGNS